MKFYKKYNINEIGISNPQYLLRHIEKYLVDENYEVVSNKEYVRFRRKLALINLRGDLFSGVDIQSYIKGNTIIVSVKYFSIYKILTLIFTLSFIVLAIMGFINTYYFFLVIISTVFTLMWSLYWLNQYLDLRKIVRKIDEMIQQLK